jgi:acyl-CoA ligase (AMP-forming) (exosortase A-associated)
MASQLLQLGLIKNQRIAIYLPKQPETVISFYAVSMSGGIFVPVNPLLKAQQVEHILHDCNVSILITSKSRYQQLTNKIDLSHLDKVILTDCSQQDINGDELCWNCLLNEENIEDTINQNDFPRMISQDIAAILYTSGSTGKPKGVVLSHANFIAGAKSVAGYLKNNQSDRLLAVLPFSFDYGLSQLTTAFISGASVVLMEYLLPRDIIKAIEKYMVTGLAAVPPLWIQLSELEWPEKARQSLRYITNSGGAMPQAILNQITTQLTNTDCFLMYGLTEAFRSTYLDPAELSARPDSIGKAIPDAEILVINREGKLCQANEPGELVHRGPHVSKGYWNAPEKTAKRFKPLPKTMANDLIVDGLIPEIAVWSGDQVVKDEQGFLYFIGREDDMIKSSGYRISPSEIEDCVYQLASVSEVTAIGLPHPTLGEAILLIIKPSNVDSFDEAIVKQHCRELLPNYMQPQAIQLKDSLPRNPNGKINRVLLSQEYSDLFKAEQSKEE